MTTSINLFGNAALNALKALNRNQNVDAGAAPTADAKAPTAITGKNAAAATGVNKAASTGFDADVQASVSASANINISINISVGAGSIPEPSVEESGSVAGQGLSKASSEWPSGAVTTAGGYTIVPEGKDAAWSVFGPGQSPSDTPLSRIWGDPHVSEGDGTKWDFTKGSDFVLPDGTRIFARTTAETGQSVTSGLEIVNGADRVTVDGINTAAPKTSEPKTDGHQWMEEHLKEGRDAFLLEHDAENKAVNWFRERNGEVDGLVTGATLQNGSYEQTVDGTKRMGELDGAATADDADGVGNVGDAAPAEVADPGAADAADPAAAEGVDGANAAGGEQNDFSMFLELLQNLFSILQQLMGGLFGGGLGNLGGLGDAVKEENGLQQQANAQRNAAIAA